MIDMRREAKTCLFPAYGWHKKSCRSLEYDVQHGAGLGSLPARPSGVVLPPKEAPIKDQRDSTAHPAQQEGGIHAPVRQCAKGGIDAHGRNIHQHGVARELGGPPCRRGLLGLEAQGERPKQALYRPQGKQCGANYDCSPVPNAVGDDASGDFQGQHDTQANTLDESYL